MPTLPTDRNLNGEFGYITAAGNQLIGANYDNLLQFGNAYAGLNATNFGNTVATIAPSMRAGFDAANPRLAAYGDELGALNARLSLRGPLRMDPLGYSNTVAAPVDVPAASLARSTPAEWVSAGPAAQGVFSPAAAQQAAVERATATTAAGTRANGGPLLRTLERDAAAGLNRPSALQARQEMIAGNLLGAGGGLTAQDYSDIEQDTRGAFAASGLMDSNMRIGAEILNKDAARRGRLRENMALAAGVDAAGQSQRNANRGYALNVQGQGQSLSTFNTGQGNELARFNASMLTDTSRFNAGQANDTSRFNADLVTRNNQFNAGRSADMSLANAGMRNDMARFDASSRNQSNQFNAGLDYSTSTFNAGQQNDMARFGSSLTQQNRQFNAGQDNDAQRFNVTAVNDASRFNTGLAYQDVNNEWGRGMDLANFYRGQTLDPTALAASFTGSLPDYTNAALGYGNDVYNTNYNSHMSRYNSARNNSAATTGAVIGGLSSIASAKIVFMCIPEGQRIDTPSGGVAIENIKPGMRVIGFDGEPVLVQMAHSYLEEPKAKRFLHFQLENGESLNVCDMHRLHSLRANTYNVGEFLGGVRIKSITAFAGVRRSYDLLTSDRGYRIAGVPVNSMIEEMARSVAA